jgi:cbb3-type cytochrome oxidase subunit 3
VACAFRGVALHLFRGQSREIFERARRTVDDFTDDIQSIMSKSIRVIISFVEDMIQFTALNGKFINCSRLHYSSVIL